MRILVTGGAGFIGSHIVDAALKAGHEVAALDNLSSGKRENVNSSAHLYEVDICDRDATFAAIKDFAPHAISHQAAQASVSVSVKDVALDAQVNVVGGVNVADAAVAARVEQLVFASTGGAIYGNIAEGQADETRAPRPESPYAIHKFTYEMLLHNEPYASQLKSTILRYANVYGPRQDPHGEAGVVAIFLQRLRKDQAISVFGMRHEGDAGCLRDYVFVPDVARANLLALEGRLAPSTYNIGTGIPTSTRELAEELTRLSAKPASLINNGPPRLGDVERSVLDGTRFGQSLGSYMALAAGLKATQEWFSR